MNQENALVERTWKPEEMALIKNVIAPKCTDEEVALMLYQAKVYKLDPLLRQIWAVKYQADRPASIFAGRDGFLAIAHQSGQFNGMESGPIRDEKGVLQGAVATVWRKDMDRPFTVTVRFEEYNKKQGNWLHMPQTMIVKVAESQALRKAFNISGIYAPEEIEEAAPKEIKEVPVQVGDHPFGETGSEKIYAPEQAAAAKKGYKKAPVDTLKH